MQKKIVRIAYFIVGVSFFLSPRVQADEKLLTKNDIPYVMDKFFRYHVEKKSLDTEIVRRWFATYLRQFDPECIYLLEEEYSVYSTMSEAQAKKIIQELHAQNFSSFDHLDTLIRNAINRSERLRANFSNWIIEANLQKINVREEKKYAKTEKQLQERLQAKLTRLYLQHSRHTKMDSAQRKQKLVQFFISKMHSKENFYLSLSREGEDLGSGYEQHLISVRILKAFAQSLDAHSSYFSEAEAQDLRFHLEKQFEGFGIVLGENMDGFFVLRLLPNSPAKKQGILAEKDFIVEMDGESVKNLSFEAVLNKLKKRKRSDIQLGVQRKEPGGLSPVFYVSLEKAPIPIDQQRISVEYSSFDQGIIGCITLRSFYDNGSGVTSAKDIQKAIGYLRSQGPLQGLILDLRENGGGFLAQAVKVAGLFISTGVVVISKYGKNEIHYLRSIDPKKAYNGPMLILTSKLSASAAEIVAQALQDYGVALVAGDERTFGKGSIQYQTITSPNTDVYFKVTIGKYYTVSGRTTQMRGVLPDISIPTSFAPFDVGEKFLVHPLQADTVEPAYQDRLVDVDPRIRGWLQGNYIPYVQKKVVIYRNMLPHLRKNSQARIKKNPRYQAFLENQKNIKKRLLGDASVPVDLLRNFSSDDLQIQEAINVMQDIIYLQKTEPHNRQNRWKKAS